MKTFLKKLLVAVAVVMSVATASGMIQSEPVWADSWSSMNHNREFLGMHSWDWGITSWEGEENLVANVWTIGANILNDLLVLAAYLAIGFIIYGGYLYMFASGDVAKTQNGKKTLTRAFIGLAIVASAKVIVNSIHIAFLGNSGAFADCATSACGVTPQGLVGNALGWFIGTASAVALIYVVIGGISYLTSAGDPGKLQKAKNTILYAIIGLIVCALAQGIVTLFIDTANNASEGTSYNQTITIKEENEKVLG